MNNKIIINKMRQKLQNCSYIPKNSIYEINIYNLQRNETSSSSIKYNRNNFINHFKQ